MGGWLVSFLSVTFGMGVIVSFAYIAKEAWLFLTGGRYGFVVDMLHCIFAFGGALMDVKLMWIWVEIINAAILAINLFGIIFLIPVVARGVRAFRAQGRD